MELNSTIMIRTFAFDDTMKDNVLNVQLATPFCIWQNW